MASIETIFFLVTSIFVATPPFIFSLLTNYSFYRKRTVGSLFLLISFGMISASELLNTASIWIGGLYGNTYANVVYWLQAFFVNLYGLAMIYFYLFSTRHILKDNEVVKSITAVILGEGVAVITTLLITYLRGGYINFEAVVEFNLANSDIPFIAPSPIMLLAIYVPLVLIILIRILISLFTLGRKITDPVAKRGTTYITISVYGLTSVMVLFILMQIPVINSSVPAMFFLQISKILSLTLMMVFGYLGWTLPDWLKKRIRGKAWIVQAFKKAEGKEITYAYSSSANAKELSNISIKEVSDP
ncbi:MAG: hypothetical protein FK734_10390 [Asgard group archaeon]|nr:hypothetical protein [Asgard group archaeon]